MVLVVAETLLVSLSPQTILPSHTRLSRQSRKPITPLKPQLTATYWKRSEGATQLKGRVLNSVTLCPRELTLPVLPGNSIAGFGSSMITPQLASRISASRAAGRVPTGSKQAPSGKGSRAEPGQEAGAVTLFVYWPPRNLEGAAMSGLSRWIRALSLGNSSLLPTRPATPGPGGPSQAGKDGGSGTGHSIVLRKGTQRVVFLDLFSLSTEDTKDSLPPAPPPHSPEIQERIRPLWWQTSAKLFPQSLAGGWAWK